MVSNFVRCDKCGDTVWSGGGHRCAEYVARIPAWTGPEEHDCWGYDAELAVEKLVESLDDDGDLLRGRNPLVVHIRSVTEAESVWHVFEVTAEAVVEYCVVEIREEESV